MPFFCDHSLPHEHSRHLSRLLYFLLLLRIADSPDTRSLPLSSPDTAPSAKKLKPWSGFLLPEELRLSTSQQALVAPPLLLLWKCVRSGHPLVTALNRSLSYSSAHTLFSVPVRSSLILFLASPKKRGWIFIAGLTALLRSNCRITDSILLSAGVDLGARSQSMPKQPQLLLERAATIAGRHDVLQIFSKLRAHLTADPPLHSVVAHRSTLDAIAQSVATTPTKAQTSSSPQPKPPAVVRVVPTSGRSNFLAELSTKNRDEVGDDDGDDAAAAAGNPGNHTSNHCRQSGPRRHGGAGRARSQRGGRGGLRQ